MATDNLDKILISESQRIAGLTGSEKALALLAFASFLTSRGVVVLNDIHARGGLDDQGVLDAARRHDKEAADAWAALQGQ